MARQEPAKAGACAIKGNISRKGEKVFHVPGSRDYDRTRISEKDGERMFCSEDEAKAAGWRAPRGNNVVCEIYIFCWRILVNRYVVRQIV